MLQRVIRWLRTGEISRLQILPELVDACCSGLALWLIDALVAELICCKAVKSD